MRTLTRGFLWRVGTALAVLVLGLLAAQLGIDLTP